MLTGFFASIALKLPGGDTSSVSKAREGQMVKGLRNLGNTCFMNSVLQSLASCPAYIDHLRALQAQLKLGPFTTEVLKCLTELRQDGLGSFYPRSIFSHLAKSNAEFKGNNEQDALELLETILSCIKEENAGAFKALRVKETMWMLGIKPSIIPNDCKLPQDTDGLKISARGHKSQGATQPAYVNPFEGWMSSHLECQSCLARVGESSLRWMPTRHQVFTTLPVPLPSSSSLSKRAGSQKISLYDCFDEFFQQEALSSVTCSACSLQSTIAAVTLQQKVFGDAQKGMSARTVTPRVDSSAVTSVAMEGMLQGLQRAHVVGRRDAHIRDFDEGLTEAVAAALAEALPPVSDDDCTTLEDEEDNIQISVRAGSCASTGDDLDSGSGGSSPTSHSEAEDGKLTAAGRSAEQKGRLNNEKRDTAPAVAVAGVTTAKSNCAVSLAGSAAVCTTLPALSSSRSSGRKSPRSLAQFSSLFSPPSCLPESVAPPPQPSAEELERLLLSLRSPVRTESVKLSAISRLPRVLCVYLNRRVYDAASGMMRKRMEHVSFPLVLNMQAYCRADGTSSSSSGGHPGSRSRAGLPSTITGGVLAGVVQGIAGMPMFGQYALRAVVEHMGSAETGHYVAYCQVQRGSERVWEYCSDERHHPVTETRVLQTQATMLFYERLPSS